MAVLQAGLSSLLGVVGVSLWTFHILISIAMIKALSTKISRGFMLVRIMSTFKGITFHLYSNPLARFFLSFVNL
jgi:hypothetical protein